jgi:hypothetical protein
MDLDWKWIAGAGVALAAVVLARGAAGKEPETEVERFIVEMGGSLPDPDRFAMNPDGIARFLHRSGITEINAASLITPDERDVDEARSLGYAFLIPPRIIEVEDDGEIILYDGWRNLAAVSLLTQWLYRSVRRVYPDAYVEVEDPYRPPDYNAEVGGRSRSAHLYALALDMDWGTSAQKRAAFEAMKRLQENRPDLRIGIGDYSSNRLHVDLLTHLGARPNTWG